MDAIDFTARQLAETKTVVFEGVILTNSKGLITIIRGFCVHNDPPEHPCPFMEHEKITFSKADIDGEIEVLDGVSAEGEKVSRVRVNRSARVVVERSVGLSAADATIGTKAFPWPQWPWCDDDHRLLVPPSNLGTRTPKQSAKLEKAEKQISRAFAAMKFVKTRSEMHQAIEAVTLAADEARRASDEVGASYSFSSWLGGLVSDAIESVGELVYDNEEDICGAISGITGGILGGFATLSSGNAAIGLAAGVAAADKHFEKCTSG